MNRLPLRGTLLNTATVIIGSLIGLAIGGSLPVACKDIAVVALGLVTLVLGIKMALDTKNILVVLGAIALGGVLGVLLGIQPFIDGMAENIRKAVGGSGRFNEGLISASVLFCVGPMTLLGCIKDGLEKDIELLAIKSTLDGISAIFFAASMGVGVLLSAVAVLVIQGGITLAAKSLKPLTDRPNLVREASAAGGLILIAIAINMLDIKKIGSAAFIPALFLAPLFAHFFVKEEVKA